MKTIRFSLILLIGFFIAPCVWAHRPSALSPVDPMLTPEALQMLTRLRQTSGKRILFGHQNATAEGVGWTNAPDRADLHDVACVLPVVYGWDYSDFHPASRIKNLKPLIEEAYRRGAVNTLSWHLNNPKTDGEYYDTTPAVPEILPGGALHEKYKASLDEFAQRIQAFRGTQGEAIPLIFRPFHEQNGSWFWWGKKSASPEDYRALWRFTVAYLRDVKEVHQLLYAYSPSAFQTEEEYLETYPGDEWVDLLGLDHYQIQDEKGMKSLIQSLEVLEKISRRKNKPFALTETGNEGLSREDWWTHVFQKAFKKSKAARRISYALFWRNGSPTHFFVPYPGQASASDFLKMTQNSLWEFERIR